MSSHLVQWTPQQFDALEEKIFDAKHNLHESGLFDDENLIRLFDLHPEVDFGWDQYHEHLEWYVRLA